MLSNGWINKIIDIIVPIFAFINIVSFVKTIMDKEAKADYEKVIAAQNKALKTKDAMIKELEIKITKLIDNYGSAS
jgi:hypothetical protein